MMLVAMFPFASGMRPRPILKQGCFAKFNVEKAKEDLSWHNAARLVSENGYYVGLAWQPH